jgi:hypothetical protein
MKKSLIKIYTVVCLLVCCIPFAGLVLFDSGESKEAKSESVRFFSDGAINLSYLKDMGDYFENNFALRTHFLDADATIMGAFGVTNTDKVVKGSDGWLYYASSVNDFLGKDTMSQRKAYNAVHNIKLLEEYVTSKGASFVFTIAPNKNSLYGEHMPYYDSYPVSSVKNIDRIKEEIEKQKVSYCDLYSVFLNEKEVLYLKKDSHWNNKGALLAYNTILDSFDDTHESYEAAKAIRTKTNIGDLNEMVYPESADQKTEWNYEYETGNTFTYDKTDDVEENFVTTTNKEGNGTLCMFRDSFGNTLIPLMAEAFEKAYFSKLATYQIEEYMDDYHPDYVIVEKVERNLAEYAQTPSILSGLQRDSIKSEKQIDSKTTIACQVSESDNSYYEISGHLDEAVKSDRVNVYVQIQDGAKKTVYEAFTISDETSDFGYLLYLKKDTLLSDTIDISIITGDQGQYTTVKTQTAELE